MFGGFKVSLTGGSNGQPRNVHPSEKDKDSRQKGKIPNKEAADDVAKQHNIQQERGPSGNVALSVVASLSEPLTKTIGSTGASKKTPGWQRVRT